MHTSGAVPQSARKQYETHSTEQLWQTTVEQRRRGRVLSRYTATLKTIMVLMIISDTATKFTMNERKLRCTLYQYTSSVISAVP